MANYYDKVLEDFNEGVLDDAYDEGVLDDAYDEGMLDEASRNDRRRPQPRFPGSIGRASNFGKGISGSSGSSQGNFATKAELKSSLNTISNQVNDLKKSTISLASSLKRLDEGYERVVKSIAKKDKAQDNIMSSSTMMTLLGTIINRPTFDPSTLQIVPVNGDDYAKTAAGTVPPLPTYKLQLDAKNTDPVNVDLTKTLLFTMMPMMMGGSGSSSDNGMMMMLPLLLILGNNNSSSTGSSSANDNTLVLTMMMMMMNKK